LALAAGRRVAGKRKCAVVSGGNIDAMVLAQLLADIRPRPPRTPRRRASERTRPPLPTVLATFPISAPNPTSAIPSDIAVEETSW